MESCLEDWAPYRQEIDPDEGLYIKCPRCSAKLVVRTGKYGQFCGCKNYPDCRFTCGTDEVSDEVK